MTEHLSPLPLVAAQPGIWLADQLSPHANAYAVAHLIKIPGALQLPEMLNAITAGLAEADTLHMQYAETDGEVTQSLGGAAVPETEVLDLRLASFPQQAATALIEEDLNNDLRLKKGKPRYRQMLMRTADNQWLWYQRYHHIDIDGFSFAALTRRIADIYSANVQGSDPGPSPFTPFSAVVTEYLDYQQSAAYQRDSQYWQEKVATLPAANSLSELPLAGQAPASGPLRCTLTLSAAELAPLYHATAAQQLTETETAVALVALWLARLSGGLPYCAGFIFMRRLGSAALTASGPVINVLPMAVDYHPDITLAELATRLAREIKTNRRHQRFNSEQLMREAGRHGDSAPLYGPVINVKMFDYQATFAGICAETEHLASGPVRDLEIALFPEQNGALTLELLANPQRYTAVQLDAHLQRLPPLITQFGRQPAQKCGEVEIVTESERQQISALNQTIHPLPPATLFSLLQQQAQATPQALALYDRDCRLTYQQMHQQVLTLAQHLSDAGAGRGDIIAVALPRSVRLSLTLQAIVAIGAIWLPLDTGYPDQRLQMMLEDAAPVLVVTEPELEERFAQLSAVPCLHYAGLLPACTAPQTFTSPRPEDGAYLIYTSGSTGRPKGVLVSHQAIVNRLLWMQDSYPLNAHDVVLQKTPSGFDVSVWEFFWPLITGAQLMMAPPEAHRDPEILLQLILDYRISTLHFVPSMLSAFVSALCTDSAERLQHQLKQVFCSGEALPTSLARHWQALCSVPFHNLYGPTEAAVDVSSYPAYGPALTAVTGNTVPIGYPVWNTALHILDNRLQPLPIGVAGELWLSGVQLAIGYLGRPSLTASRFVALPGGNGERMYRTGDIVRRLENGAIEYLGRNDDQLKIRGQRIELTEIDHQLLALPGVTQAVTLARTLGKTTQTFEDARQLVAYVIGDNLPDSQQLRATLEKILPPPMVPVAIVEMETFPLSPNGKLDRNALPLPTLSRDTPQRAPAPGLETQIAQAFAALLQRDDISAESDFFALGGHSLLAMRLAAQLRQQVAQPVTVGQIMVASTVEKLAAVLTAPDSVDSRHSGRGELLPLRQGEGPTLFCFHPASGFAWQFSILNRYLDRRWSITGIQSPTAQGALGRSQNIEQLCDAHLQQVRAQQPHGPYYFIGYSLGGTLAQGIAARLEAAGETVAFLGLLDTWPPESQRWQERQGEAQTDPQVLEEVERERQAFMASQRTQAGEEMAEMFDTISANYANAVRLLATARSAVFHGKATLFVAEKTRQPEMNAAISWAPFLPDTEVIPVNCCHAEIFAPAVFDEIGPQLARRLSVLLP